MDFHSSHRQLPCANCDETMSEEKLESVAQELFLEYESASSLAQNGAQGVLRRVIKKPFEACSIPKLSSVCLVALLGESLNNIAHQIPQKCLSIEENSHRHEESKAQRRGKNEKNGQIPRATKAKFEIENISHPRSICNLNNAEIT